MTTFTKLYRTSAGIIIEESGTCLRLEGAWDAVFTAEDPAAFIAELAQHGVECDAPAQADILAPIEHQEVWAAGVTYYRSRTARMEESQDAGGGTFYDRVYEAERPELFFKANRHRVAPPGGPVRIRSDATWNVPEPELTLVVNSRGRIFGYTIGNDMSSRDIEGANPLYLPQAKVYNGCCALGPGILISGEPLPSSTKIELTIERAGQVEFEGSTTLEQLKRTPEELVAYLFRDNIFPFGCFLLTGTGIVPPDSFTLQSGDVIRISIDSLDTLINTVA